MNYSACDNKKVSFEKKLDDIFNFKTNGFFIELGANDGFNSSNTYFFEKYREWKGILIEPSIKGYEKCKINRPNSLCLNYACVSNDYTDEFIYGDFDDNHAMGSIYGKRLNRNNLIKVKAITLENILDSYTENQKIDFLSLDTEGYELNILKGLNLHKYRPHYMLIEIYNYDYDKLTEFLKEKHYRLHSNFSNYNFIDNKGWDGTHNDFLFIDNLL